MDSRTWKNINLTCICGHVSRNVQEEAKHRHNFPLYCKIPMRQCRFILDHKAKRQCQHKTRDPSKLCHMHRKHHKTSLYKRG